MTKMASWNRCDDCGRFIPLDDFVDGLASHKLLAPDSDLGTEQWETLCRRHLGYCAAPILGSAVEPSGDK